MTSSRPPTNTATRTPRKPSDVRQAILDTAYELFSTRGIQAVGVDEIIKKAEVAKASLYTHFSSKNELALAFLQQREQVWVRDWVGAETSKRGSTPEEQLLAIFDLFDEWFHQDDFEGCSFINVLVEFGGADGHPLGQACAVYLETLRSAVLGPLAEQAGLRDPDSFACSWHILMQGSIVQAMGGDRDAAKRAKKMAHSLIDQYR